MRLVRQIGFISELPHGLVDAFRLTLADVSAATVLVHVRDVIHPESERQGKEVMSVLSNEMSLPQVCDRRVRGEGEPNERE